MERGAVQYFFFSYARNDSVDPYLRQFYDDLCNELSVRAGIRKESTGFFDIDQPTGTNWPATTGEAVGTCKVFVPVYSPWYFNSKPCGSEWHGFDRRLEQHRARTGETLASVLPVWWLPPEYEPPPTKYLHDTRDQFGVTYRESGLRSLITQAKHKDEYRAFLEKFAVQVRDAGRTPPRELHGVDLRTEPDAFARRVPTTAAAAVSGPKRVNFVVAVGSCEQMSTVRATLDAYGEGWDDWCPYVPDCVEPVVLKAQDVAVEQRMISGPVPAGRDLIDVLDLAQQRREIVVLIVDPWAVGLDDYRELLALLDTRRYNNVTIMFPGDEGEPRTLSNGVDAGDVLRLCIGNWLDDQSRAVRQDLGTVAKFEDELKRALIDTRARIVNRADVARRVRQSGATTRPVLIGPEG
ncbi:TIR-like protein FxsC [Lentzea nigeriaca]|uniref:TIR-like protein FxsC n=1 Tax=Lentzea nigeriaca TaxID=1128665 RepID=UPI001957E1E5|nr:TIR-like protein FxsC [Lentzea nigeriaca]MBM7857007.1 FxsC-like protein [Lentzea nigeriaca]